MVTRPAHKQPPLYGWALEPDGTPVPIAAAKRGQSYTCPVCHRTVVAKLGDVNQHHFSHLDVMPCTPEAVARKVAGIWLTRALREALLAKRPVNIEWEIPQTGEVKTLDALMNVARVEKDYSLPLGKADVALIDAHGKPLVALMLGIQGTPSASRVVEWIQSGIAVVLLNSVLVRHGRLHPSNILAGARLEGGWLLLENQENLVTNPDKIKQILRGVVSDDSPIFYAELGTEGALSHILKVHGQKLWLPPEVWQQTIGGSKNKLGPDVHVYIQEWKEGEDCVTEIFYITARKTAAIALRRCPDGKVPSIRIDPSFRRDQTTALDLARQLTNQI
jgi:hypothetical protein